MASRFDWTFNETDGLYERLADPCELMFINIELRSTNTMKLTSFVTLDFGAIQEREVVPRLRKAWRRIGVENAQVLVQYDTEKKKLVCDAVDTPDKLDQWTSETFKVVEEAESAQTIFEKSQSEFRGNLFYLPRSQQVVIQISHGLTESHGLCFFFDKLLKLFNENVDADPAQFTASSLPPSLAAALGVTEWNIQDAIPIAKALQATEGKGRDAVTANVIPYEPKLPSRMSYIMHDFTKDETAAILKKAKSNGATYTQLLFAVGPCHLSQVAANLEPDEPALSHTLLVVSARSNIAEKYRNTVLGCYVIGWKLSVPVSESLEKCLEVVKAGFGKHLSGIRSPDPAVAQATWRMNFALFDLYNQMPAMPPMSISLSYSTVGVIDEELLEDYSGVKVKNFYVGTDRTTATINTFSYSASGKLHHTYSYNKNFYDSKDMERWVKDDVELLLK